MVMWVCRGGAVCHDDVGVQGWGSVSWCCGCAGVGQCVMVMWVCRDGQCVMVMWVCRGRGGGQCVMVMWVCRGGAVCPSDVGVQGWGSVS